MEPNVATIALHPAVLIASGFECVSSSQVRFLNAHRRHFHKKLYDLNETISIQNVDFELGGILNPHGEFWDLSEAKATAASLISNYPYASRRDIFNAFYLEDVNKIWSELMIELFEDLSKFCILHKRSRDYFLANTQVIHDLYPYEIYHKISALHLCGLGAKLIEAFRYVFQLFQSYEIRSAEPAPVRR